MPGFPCIEVFQVFFRYWYARSSLGMTERVKSKSVSDMGLDFTTGWPVSTKIANNGCTRCTEAGQYSVPCLTASHGNSCLAVLWHFYWRRKYITLETWHNKNNVKMKLNRLVSHLAF